MMTVRAWGRTMTDGDGGRAVDGLRKNWYICGPWLLPSLMVDVTANSVCFECVHDCSFRLDKQRVYNSCYPIRSICAPLIRNQ